MMKPSRPLEPWELKKKDPAYREERKRICRIDKLTLARMLFASGVCDGAKIHVSEDNSEGSGPVVVVVREEITG